MLVGPNPAHADKTFTVNSTSDAPDFAFNGSCDADIRTSVNPCTLRAAIQEANHSGNPGAGIIIFNIPSTDPKCNATSGICTISPGSALPTIAEALSINGYTQRPCSPVNPAPCSRANTSTVGTNAVLLIQLNGANSTSSEGLRIEASNSVVKGLVINRFDVGISTNGTFDFPNPTGNRIEGNFVGANAAGTADLGIDMSNNGRTTNDVGDEDEGPNNPRNTSEFSAARKVETGSAS